MLEEEVHKLTTESDYLKKWIVDFLDKPQDLLNNFPVCPYAKPALEKNKILFFTSYDFSTDIVKIFQHWQESYDVVVCILKQKVSADEITREVKNLNNRFLSKGFCCLEDHIDIPENLKDLCFNNGRYNIILCQKTTLLNNASKTLMNKGYYQNWTDDMYQNVVAWRFDLN